MKARGDVVIYFSFGFFADSFKGPRGATVTRFKVFSSRKQLSQRLMCDYLRWLQSESQVPLRRARKRLEIWRFSCEAEGLRVCLLVAAEEHLSSCCCVLTVFSVYVQVFRKHQQDNSDRGVNASLNNPKLNSRDLRCDQYFIKTANSYFSALWCTPPLSQWPLGLDWALKPLRHKWQR